MSEHPGSVGLVPTQSTAGELERLMHLYEFVFNPLVFSAAAVLLLVVYEWRRNSGERSGLLARLGAVFGAMFVGTLPALAYVLVSPVGASAALVDPPWQVDVASTVGEALAAILIWAVWRHFDWGEVLPGGALVILGVLVPYAAIAPFWNVSGHVTFTTAVALYLAYVDRRMAPVLVFPPVTIVNRVYLDAHTWLQAVSGFVLALVVVAAVVALVLKDRVDPLASVRPTG